MVAPVVPPSDTISLRITLRYKDLEEFVERYAENVSAAGLFLRTKAPKAPGTKIRFELLLSEGSRALRGEGVVVTVRGDDKPGMALRFNQLEPESQAVVDRIVTAHGQGALAPTPLAPTFARLQGADGAGLGRGAPGWRSNKPQGAGWGTGALPRPGAASSILPRRAEPSAEEGGAEPAAPLRKPLPRQKSTISRPWAPPSEGAASPLEALEASLSAAPSPSRPQALELSRSPALDGRTERISLLKAVEERTQRLTLPPAPPTPTAMLHEIAPSLVGEARVATDEFESLPLEPAFEPVVGEPPAHANVAAPTIEALAPTAEDAEREPADAPREADTAEQRAAETVEAIAPELEPLVDEEPRPEGASAAPALRLEEEPSREALTIEAPAPELDFLAEAPRPEDTRASAPDAHETDGAQLPAAPTVEAHAPIAEPDDVDRAAPVALDAGREEAPEEVAFSAAAQELAELEALGAETVALASRPPRPFAVEEVTAAELAGGEPEMRSLDEVLDDELGWASFLPQSSSASPQPLQGEEAPFEPVLPSSAADAFGLGVSAHDGEDARTEPEPPPGEPASPPAEAGPGASVDVAVANEDPEGDALEAAAQAEAREEPPAPEPTIEAAEVADAEPDDVDPTTPPLEARSEAAAVPVVGTSEVEAPPTPDERALAEAGPPHVESEADRGADAPFDDAAPIDARQSAEASASASPDAAATSADALADEARRAELRASFARSLEERERASDAMEPPAPSAALDAELGLHPSDVAEAYGRELAALELEREPSPRHDDSRDQDSARAADAASETALPTAATASEVTLLPALIADEGDDEAVSGAPALAASASDFDDELQSVLSTALLETLPPFPVGEVSISDLPRSPSVPAAVRAEPIEERLALASLSFRPPVSMAPDSVAWADALGVPPSTPPGAIADAQATAPTREDEPTQALSTRALPGAAPERAAADAAADALTPLAPWAGEANAAAGDEETGARMDTGTDEARRAVTKLDPDVGLTPPLAPPPREDLRAIFARAEAEMLELEARAAAEVHDDDAATPTAHLLSMDPLQAAEAVLAEVERVTGELEDAVIPRGPSRVSAPETEGLPHREVAAALLSDRDEAAIRPEELLAHPDALVPEALVPHEAGPATQVIEAPVALEAAQASAASRGYGGEEETALTAPAQRARGATEQTSADDGVAARRALVDASTELAAASSPSPAEPQLLGTRVMVTGLRPALEAADSDSELPAPMRPPPRTGPLRPAIEREAPTSATTSASAPPYEEERTEVPTSSSAPLPLLRVGGAGKKTSVELPRLAPSVEHGTRVLGVDFGGQSVRVGLLERGELELLSSAGSPHLPALVAARQDGSLVTGAKARAIRLDHPDRAVSPRALLRALGRPELADTLRMAEEQGRWTVLLGERRHELDRLLTVFFAGIREAIHQELGHERFRVVLSVPLDLEPEARQRLLAACVEARLQVARLETEPDAMLRAYNLEEHGVDSALLVDVGATHAAVTVVRRAREGFAVVASAWENELSAGTLDGRVADLALDELARQAGEDHRADPAARLRLQEAAELARLDIRRAATLELKATLPAPGGASGVGLERTLRLPRSRVYQLTEDLVAALAARARDLLRDSGIAPRSIGAIVVAGSAGQYPPLLEALTELTHREPLIAVPPSHVLALGLARSGAAEERAEASRRPDALVASIGMELTGGRFRALLPAGTRLPTTLERTYPTTRDNQTEIELRFFQGDAEFVRSCAALGPVALRGLSRADKGEVKIALALSVAADGVVTIRLSEPRSGLVAELITATQQTPEERRRQLGTSRGPTSSPRREVPSGSPPPKRGLFERLFGKK
jgi:uncharacterized protein (TIGR02266 family)